jgi:ABC-type molybdate transport system permease subunit
MIRMVDWTFGCCTRSILVLSLNLSLSHAQSATCLSSISAQLVSSYIENDRSRLRSLSKELLLAPFLTDGLFLLVLGLLALNPLSIAHAQVHHGWLYTDRLFVVLLLP